MVKQILLAGTLLISSAVGTSVSSLEAAPRAVQRTTTAAAVVAAANTFINTLSSSQRTALLQSYTKANAIKWSNLPQGAATRLGLRLVDLSTAQQVAALAVVQAATGTTANEGYSEVQQVRAADDNLVANGGGSNYGSGIYYIAFLVSNTSATAITTSETWQLQFGGHHLAVNKTYAGGAETGATPQFEGLEPKTFTTANSNVIASGTTLAPMADEHDRLASMIGALTSGQKTTAKLSQTFGDVVLGPGSDGQFPNVKVGIAGSSLTPAQRALVLAAIKPWLLDDDDAHAATLLATYASELNSTYISYSGTGNFTTNADYARIDGPHVWIEFVCQTGVIYRSQIHYHSIWRDHTSDYGNNFTF